MDKLQDWIWRLAWFGLIGGLAYLGEKDVDGGFIKDIWNSAKTASPFAAMLALFLLFDQIKERREAQRQCNERTIDYIRSTNLQTTAADKVAGSLSQLASAVQIIAGPKHNRRSR